MTAATTTTDDPRTLMSAWAEAINTNDARRLASVFADDAEFVNLYGSVWTGRAAIIDGHAWALSSVLEGSIMHVDQVEQRLVADGVVVLRGRCRRERVAGASPATLPSGTTVLLIVAQLGRDGWRAVAGANVAQASAPSS